MNKNPKTLATSALVLAAASAVYAQEKPYTAPAAPAAPAAQPTAIEKFLNVDGKLPEALAKGNQVGFIAIAREEIEATHHTGDLFIQVMDLGEEIAGVKDIIPGKFFLHVSHDFQGLIVVVQEAPEMGEFFLQADLLVLFGFFKKAAQEFKKHAHWFFKAANSPCIRFHSRVRLMVMRMVSLRKGLVIKS